jgi:hypothetical protein
VVLYLQGFENLSTEDHRTTNFSFFFLVQDETTAADFTLTSSRASNFGSWSGCGGDLDDPDLCLIKMEGACSDCQMADPMRPHHDMHDSVSNW